jgi:hypothetical protein
MNSRHPLARKNRLVTRELNGELLVYDLARDRALCLNPLAAAVWKQSDGRKTAAAIAADVSRQLSATVDEKTVYAAIDQLGRDHLLEYCVAMPTRRQQLKSLGKSAAIAGPLVTVLSAPTFAQGRSCIPSNQPCVPGGTPCCNKNAICAAGRRGTERVCLTPGEQ